MRPARRLQACYWRRRWHRRWAMIVATALSVLLLGAWALPLPQSREVIGPYGPAQLRTAYDIQPLLEAGIDGRGRTVVLYEFPVPASEAAHASNIYQDLGAYDQHFGLPPASLQVYSGFARGANPALANVEEVLDAEVVHAVAPQARIEVLLASPLTVQVASGRDLLLAVRYALTHQLGDVISFSLGLGEQCFSAAQADAVHAVTKLAAAEDVTLVAGSGDWGVVSRPCQPTTTASALAGVIWPASDPLVTAVGGTRLLLDPSGNYRSETAWNSPPRPHPIGDPFGSTPHSEASGGGFSQLFGRPDYQAGVPGITGGRGVPDVAADADTATGIAIVTVVTASGQRVLRRIGGTSAGAPLWAGLAALADQYAGRRLGLLNPALYRIAESPQYSAAFHAVTSGTNTVTFPPRVITGYSAGPGWNPVTGWGSPDAAVLIPLLAR
jgi:subtilase family serine protease